jgi:hypothetical protein
MRGTVCGLIVAAFFAAQPTLAQPDRTASQFWRAVQATCSATAAKPASELGRRIAQAAVHEFIQFGGHQIDANGRLFHFGLTEAKHQGEEGERRGQLGDLGWRQVMKYWRALYGEEIAEKLEVRGYRDGSTSTDEAQAAALLRTTAGRLLRAAEGEADPAEREILRETALRAAIIDTPWSAAFISYVVRQSGVSTESFCFAKAHPANI